MKTRIAGLAERDLDLLFAEECVVNAPFREHLLRAAGISLDAPDSVLAVRRGATHSTGESDLELDTQLADGTRVRLLIENKVDAALQHRQAERYAERARSYVAHGACEIARTLVVAPDRYFGEEDAGFHGDVTYEELIELLRTAEGDPARIAFRVSILESAIEKATLGYQRKADDAMNELWRQYRAIAAELAPELNVPLADGRPTGSHFVYFKPDGFPRPIQLIHKFVYGRVDVQFPRWGPSLGLLRQRLAGVMPDGHDLVRAGKSVALRRQVEPVTVSASLSERDGPIRAGVLAAQALLQWSHQHRALLEELREAPSQST